jgi:hypothetical protein
MWECTGPAMLDASVDLYRSTTLPRTRHVAPSLAFATYTVFMGSWFGALVLWSRRCEAHKGHIYPPRGAS